MADGAPASMLDAVEDSIAAATWLTEADNGTCELLLRLAARMDDPDFPVIDGRFDNVTESLFLKTAAALGLTPEMRATWEKREKKSSGSNLAKLRAGAASLRAV